MNKKRKEPTRAADLYISTWFSHARDYAELTTLTNPDDKWYIRKQYGLLFPNQVIEPYDTSLNKMKAAQRCEWAKGVLSQLIQETDSTTTCFIVLAGRHYREPLVGCANVGTR